jgi:hypothetical protein
LVNIEKNAEDRYATRSIIEQQQRMKKVIGLKGGGGVGRRYEEGSSRVCRTKIFDRETSIGKTSLGM